MKKILSLVLVTVMVMSLSIPVFAAKPAWVGNDKDDEEIEEALPKGLQDKAVIPYGHRKDQEVSVEDMEALIEEVEDYIDSLDMDSDDDSLDDATEADELAVELIDLEEAEELALGEVDGDIVKMSFNGYEYEFEILLGDILYEVEVGAISEDVDIKDEDEDEEYDLQDVMTYYEAKEVAIDAIADEEEIDSDDVDGIFIEVELDIEEEDNEREAIYKVKVMTDELTYEIEIDALEDDDDNNVLSVKSYENDDDDWMKDRDRDRDRDGDNEGMVSAIENLIARIEYKLAKDESKLGHYMFQLENKFNILQKIYGEKEYDAFKDDADEYLDQLDEIVEEKNVEALIEEIKEFIFANNFGTSIGNFSPNEAMELLTLVFEYDNLESEDLEEYFEDLKLEYRKFKMSKLVAGDYLETINEYQEELELLEDVDLTKSEEESRDDLIELIKTINENKKMALGTFYDIEEEALKLLDQEMVDYEKELNDLIEEVQEAFLKSYKDVNQDDLSSEKSTLLAEYFVALASRKVAVDADDFEDILDDLEIAFNNFNDFLNQ